MPRVVERHSATLKLDTAAKQHLVAVAKVRGVDWREVPVSYTIPDVAADVVVVTVEGDAAPCGTAGWYSEGQIRGRVSAESPLARKLREAEERHLLEVGRAIHRRVARKKKAAPKAAKIAEMLPASRAEGLKPAVLVRKVAAATKATPRYVRKVAKTVSHCNAECNLEPSGAPLSA